MPLLPIRDVSLFVDIVGSGYPLALMHGGPGADHWTLEPLRPLRDRYTLVFYDHRCNGRSVGAEVSTMTWENLTADADALREHLGFEQWAVFGHSFGGHVALEYALRYPERLSRLVLLDTGGDSWWSLVNAGDHLARHGYSPEVADLARRFLNGQIEPTEFLPDLMKLGGAYNPHTTLGMLAHELLGGTWRTRARPQALMFAARHLLPGWTVMDRLGEIRVPTLIMAGRDDFIFPPEHQAELAAGIPGSHLKILDGAGHNPQIERLYEVLEAVREFVRPEVAAATR